jgi:hypothetical protein
MHWCCHQHVVTYASWFHGCSPDASCPCYFPLPPFHTDAFVLSPNTRRLRFLVSWLFTRQASQPLAPFGTRVRKCCEVHCPPNERSSMGIRYKGLTRALTNQGRTVWLFVFLKALLNFPSAHHQRFESGNQTTGVVIGFPQGRLQRRRASTIQLMKIGRCHNAGPAPSLVKSLRIT